MPEINGTRVRELREEQYLSLTMLEERSGVSRETILAIEQGNRPRIHQSTLHKLANALGVTPGDLVKKENA